MTKVPKIRRPFKVIRDIRSACGRRWLYRAGMIVMLDTRKPWVDRLVRKGKLKPE
jgi:hypothetical protein